MLWETTIIDDVTPIDFLQLNWIYMLLIFLC